MVNPYGLVSLEEGLNVAVKVMRENGISSAFVTNRNRQLQGMITIDRAIDGIKQKKALGDVLSTNVKTVRPEDYVQDIIQYALESKYPLVVVNEEEEIQGIILRVHVLASLISDNTVENEEIEAVKEVEVIN